MPELFKAKVRKVGTSLGILIPKEFAEKEKIKEGETVDVGMLKESRIKIIDKAFGSAKGARPFSRDRSERSERY